jgi:hypothetical protein
MTNGAKTLVASKGAAESKLGRLRSRPGFLLNCQALALRGFGATARSVGACERPCE